MTRMILDADECAEIMRCSPKQVEELARQGELAGAKPGRSWLFLYEDVVEFLRQRARQESEARRAKLQAPATPISRRSGPPPL